jgi:hypothetical protein
VFKASSPVSVLSFQKYSILKNLKTAKVEIKALPKNGLYTCPSAQWS